MHSRLLSVLCSAAWAVAVVVAAEGTIPCDDNIPRPKVPGAQVIALSAQERHNVSGLVVREHVPKIDQVSGLNVCNVNVSIIHSGEFSKPIEFEIWLPLNNWNGRFQGVGGGGWVSGHHGTQGLGIAVESGFAAGIHRVNISDQAGELHSDVVSETGVVNIGLLSDLSFRGPHELAVIGKAITASYYGKPAHHSYWNGCSQGGRQGYQLAQRYPDDFDGILANAPAIYWPSFLVSMSWGHLVSRWKGHDISLCVADEARKASVRFCDELDGVLDGVISNPDACDFDPDTIIGTEVSCGNSTVVISAEDTEVLRLYHQGARSPLGTLLWEKPVWGMNYSGIFPESGFSDWIGYFVKKDRNYRTESLDTLEEYTELFATAHADYGGIIGTDQVDLSAFKESGGKLLTWHGAADDLIMLNNTVRYRKDVEAVMGGNERVNEFYRFFVAPGVGHCFLGNGAYPIDAFDSLIAWVEEGRAPEVLHGSMTTPDGETASRKICPWPLVPRYDGEGDNKNAESYNCASSFGPGRGKC